MCMVDCDCLWNSAEREADSVRSPLQLGKIYFLVGIQIKAEIILVEADTE